MIYIENVWEKEWFHRLIDKSVYSAPEKGWYRFHLKPEVSSWIIENHIRIRYKIEYKSSMTSDTGILYFPRKILEYGKGFIDFHISFESEEDLNLTILTW